MTAPNGREQVFWSGIPLYHPELQQSPCRAQNLEGASKEGPKSREGERGKDLWNILGWYCLKGKAGAVKQ